MSQSTPAKEIKKKQNLRYQRDKDREMVKGVFKFYEVPGGTLSFSYRKYKEDEVENFTLIDGQIYTIPLGVAKHLNNNGWYPEYEHVPGDPSTKIVAGQSNGMRIKKKVHRFGFQSLEFVDVDDLADNENPIVEVEFNSEN